MSNALVKIRELSKSFGPVKAVDRLSVEMNRGQIFGVLGPDGAGKTSLFRLIASLYKPDSGELEVLGLDPVKDYKKLRPLLGYMPGEFALYQDLSVEENLRFFASLFHVNLEQNYYLIESIFKSLEPFKKRLVRNLSGGMKQKLALSCALIHEPQLLILDEPTTGVDAVSRVEFWNNLKALKEKGLTIIVSTSYMDEATRCDKVMFMQNGKKLALGSPDDLINNFDLPVFSIYTDKRVQVTKALRHPDFQGEINRFGATLHYIPFNKSLSMEQLMNYLIEFDPHINIEKSQPMMEDIFLWSMKSVVNE